MFWKTIVIGSDVTQTVPAHSLFCCSYVVSPPQPLCKSIFSVVKILIFQKNQPHLPKIPRPRLQFTSCRCGRCFCLWMCLIHLVATQCVYLQMLRGSECQVVTLTHHCNKFTLQYRHVHWLFHGSDYLTIHCVRLGLLSAHLCTCASYSVSKCLAVFYIIDHLNSTLRHVDLKCEVVTSLLRRSSRFLKCV